MPIRAGRLDRKVEIFENVISTDANTGEQLKTRVSKGFAWAAVRAINTKERMQSGRAELAANAYEVEIRFNNLSVTDELLYDGYYLNIQSMSPRGRRNRETVNLMCEVLEPNNLVA